MRQNQCEIERLVEMNHQIEKRLNRKRPSIIRRGIAIRLISELFCPKCSCNLELERPELVHNEVMTGELCCPVCGKKYDIRYGCISDEPLEPLEEFSEVGHMLENYLQQNDEEYVVKVRELFMETAHCVREASQNARTALIDGQSVAFLNRSIIRSIPKGCLLVVSCRGNLAMKLLQEDVLPENVIFYNGDRKNLPVRRKFDYIFQQDYDIQIMNDSDELYLDISPGAAMNCFKILMKTLQRIADEHTFLNDMKKQGWQKISEYKTGAIIKKADSADLSLIETEKDMEIQYAVYGFKTLG